MSVCCRWECILVQPLRRTAWTSRRIKKICFMIQLFYFWVYSQRKLNPHTKRYLQVCVVFIPDVEWPRSPSMDRRMKRRYVCMLTGVLLSPKEEWTPVVGSKMDRAGEHCWRDNQAQEKFFAFSFTVGAMNFVTITLYMVNTEVFPMRMKWTKLYSDMDHQLLSRENGWAEPFFALKSKKNKSKCGRKPSMSTCFH